MADGPIYILDPIIPTTPPDPYIPPATPDDTPKTGWLFGKVTTVSGTPIVGATVACNTTIATSDVNGNYQTSTIEIGYYNALCSAGGYRKSNAGVVITQDTGSKCDFRLSTNPGTPGESGVGNIYGTVYDTGGNAVVSSLVSAGGISCITDDNGAYTIDSLAVGVYDITCTKYGYSSITIEDFGVTTSGNEEVNFTLSKLPPNSPVVPPDTPNENLENPRIIVRLGPTDIGTKFATALWEDDPNSIPINSCGSSIHPSFRIHVISDLYPLSSTTTPTTLPEAGIVEFYKPDEDGISWTQVTDADLLVTLVTASAYEYVYDIYVKDTFTEPGVPTPYAKNYHYRLGVQVKNAIYYIVPPTGLLQAQFAFYTPEKSGYGIRISQVQLAETLP